jgi:flagella basal body P-ring formation protein FlgA
VIALLLAALSGDPAALAASAAARALAVPGGRAEVLALEAPRPRGCAASAAELAQPLAASGRVAVRLRGADGGGAPCEAWAWARVRVTAPALVAARDVAEGEALDGALRLEEREVAAGRAPVAALPAAATAARRIAAGTSLDPAHLRVGPAPGEPLPVVVRLGGLTVEQPGRAVACGRGRACAVLPSGRRVEGALEAGRLIVEVP